MDQSYTNNVYVVYQFLYKLREAKTCEKRLREFSCHEIKDQTFLGSFYTGVFGLLMKPYIQNDTLSNPTLIMLDIYRNKRIPKLLSNIYMVQKNTNGNVSKSKPMLKDNKPAYEKEDPLLVYHDQLIKLILKCGNLARTFGCQEEYPDELYRVVCKRFIANIYPFRELCGFFQKNPYPGPYHQSFVLNPADSHQAEGYKMHYYRFQLKVPIATSIRLCVDQFITHKDYQVVGSCSSNMTYSIDLGLRGHPVPLYKYSSVLVLLRKIDKKGARLINAWQKNSGRSREIIDYLTGKKGMIDKGSYEIVIYMEHRKLHLPSLFTLSANPVMLLGMEKDLKPINYPIDEKVREAYLFQAFGLLNKEQESVQPRNYLNLDVQFIQEKGCMYLVRLPKENYASKRRLEEVMSQHTRKFYVTPMAYDPKEPATLLVMLEPNFKL